MVRVITQETFDSVVKENMEEFEMGKEEAIKEAKEQFETQVMCPPICRVGLKDYVEKSPVVYVGLFCKLSNLFDFRE